MELSQFNVMEFKIYPEGHFGGSIFDIKTRNYRNMHMNMQYD